MLFLPGSSDPSNVCLGLEERQAARPAISPSLYDTLTALNVTWCTIFALSIPVLYWLRNEPRFARIRPFSLSLLMLLVNIFYLQGCFLPAQRPGFPCALELFMHVMPYGLAACITSARALVFVCETRYSVLVSQEINIIREQTASSSASTVSSHHGEGEVSFLTVFKRVLAVGYGCSSVDTLSLQVLSNLRRRYVPIFSCFLIPSVVITYTIAVLTVPQYRMGCTDCGITLEFLIAALVFPSICVIFMARYIYIGYGFHQDPQHVVQEMLVTVATAPVWSYLGYALDIADPNGWSYNREFSYAIVISLCGIVFWFHVAFWQIVRALQYRFSQRTFTRDENTLSSSDPRNRKDFMEEYNSDPLIRNEFYAFATARYAIEVLKFVDDVRAFKAQFESHNDVWRRKKAKELYCTYIRTDAPLEVNIASGQRERMLRINVDEISVLRLSKLFDEACEEVSHSMLRGMWIEFKVLKRSENKRRVAASSMGVSSAAAELA